MTERKMMLFGPFLLRCCTRATMTDIATTQLCQCMRAIVHVCLCEKSLDSYVCVCVPIPWEISSNSNTYWLWTLSELQRWSRKKFGICIIVVSTVHPSNISISNAKFNSNSNEIGHARPSTPNRRFHFELRFSMTFEWIHTHIHFVLQIDSSINFVHEKWFVIFSAIHLTFRGNSASNGISHRFCSRIQVNECIPKSTTNQTHTKKFVAETEIIACYYSSQVSTFSALHLHPLSYTPSLFLSNFIKTISLHTEQQHERREKKSFRHSNKFWFRNQFHGVYVAALIALFCNKITL